MTDEERVTYFAETDARNKLVKFGIKSKDRSRHMYVIGKTGMGKSTLLENMAAQDIQNGEGFAFIDPHGKSAELLLNYIPENRIKDVLYFAPFDVEYPISFNVMEDVGYDKRHLVVSGLMTTFKKIWQDAWSARMEYILSNTLLALLEYPGATLLGVNKMLSDKEYRKKVVENITDPAVKSFWVDEFAKYTEKFAAEATPAIQDKIGQFTNNPLIRNLIGQPKSSFDLRKMMDEGKIIIVNLSKGRVGEQNANLLGSMLVTKIYLAAMSRADVSEKAIAKLPHFYLYVDEFQNFANESFADILSEARKYKLNLIIAHQYIEQMVEEVRSAVFGNVGTMIVFRVGAYDADVLEKEFAPKFTAEDIVNLGKYQIYLRLMIDGMGSQPFSATNMPPIPEPTTSFRDQVVKNSQMVFGRERAAVEEYIKEQTLGKPESKPENKQDDRAKFSTQSSQSQFTPKPRGDYSQSTQHSPQHSSQSSRDSRQADRSHDRPQERQPERADRREERRPENRIEKPVSRPVDRPIPPSDPSDGFQSLKNIRPSAITEESKKDLRQALASLTKVPTAPKTAPKVEQKPAPKTEHKSEPKPPSNEVPEDVLKRILDVK